MGRSKPVGSAQRVRQVQRELSAKRIDRSKPVGSAQSVRRSQRELSAKRIGRADGRAQREL